MKSCSLLFVTLWVISSCRSGPDKIRIKAASVSQLIVYNRGEYAAYDRRLITNRDTISLICELLNRAQHVSIDTISVKQSLRFARFDIYDKQHEVAAEFSYNITPKDGNILWYAGSRFRSDSLDQYLK